MTGRAGLVLTLIAVGASWGMTISFTKIATTGGANQFALIFWQMVISVIMLGAIQFARRARIGFRREYFGYFIAIAFIGTIIPNFATYTAIRYLPVSIPSIFIAVVPIFSLIFSLAMGVERANALRILGVLCGLTSVAIILGPEATFSDLSLVILLIGLFPAMCYGAEGVYVALKQPRALEAGSALFGASVLGVLILAPVQFVPGVWLDPFVVWDAPRWALLWASILHGFSYAGFMYLVVRAGPVFTAQVSYVVTLSGILFGMWFFGEENSVWIWLAMALMMLGMTLVRPQGDAARA